ncbi:MAG TPA: 50S ribosomal protein L35 [Patescibacteria group bacterium]|nr:50S ribosomal protein L35 [Patescibacteria group bacterium]
MPKLKTKKILTKRLRITKNGKVMRGQSFRRHLNEKKSSKRKRRLSGMIVSKKTFAKKVKKALGK